MKEVDPKQDNSVNRRLFMTRMGTFGLGAVGATSLLAACGASNSTNNGLPTAAVSRAFKDIAIHENNHVAFLKTAIPSKGGTARPAPTFDKTQAAWNPTDINTFQALADALENTGTGAYIYAAKFLAPLPDVLTAAAQIALVEGRHAGFLNILTGRPVLTDPTPGQNDSIDPTNVGGGNFSMEVPQPPSIVLQRAAPFLVNVNLNGGPPPPNDTFTNLGSDTNSIIFNVLNYALLLEYLEAQWYTKNVPLFYP